MPPHAQPTVSSTSADSAYAGSEYTKAGTESTGSSQPDIVPLPNHGQLEGVGSERNLAVNRGTGEIFDDDTGEVVTTTTTTTTTTTRHGGRRHYGGHAPSSQVSSAGTPGSVQQSQSTPAMPSTTSSGMPIAEVHGESVPPATLQAQRQQPAPVTPQAPSDRPMRDTPSTPDFSRKYWDQAPEQPVGSVLETAQHRQSTYAHEPVQRVQPASYESQRASHSPPREYQRPQGISENFSRPRSPTSYRPEPTSYKPEPTNYRPEPTNYRPEPQREYTSHAAPQQANPASSSSSSNARPAPAGMSTDKWEALEELKKAGKEAAPAWKSTLKNLEGVAVGLHAVGKTIEPKLDEMDRRQAEKYAQNNAQRNQATNNRAHTAAMSREEQRRAKSRERTWGVTDDDRHTATAPQERQRFRSASPDHPALNPRVRAISPPAGLRAEEMPLQSNGPSTGGNSGKGATTSGDQAKHSTNRTDPLPPVADGKKDEDGKKAHGGMMNKLKKKLGGHE